MTEPTTRLTAAPIDIINVRVPGYRGLQRISINSQGIITNMLPMEAGFKGFAPPDLQLLDLAGDWVSLGGIDLQINGALGLAFPDITDDDRDKLQQICQFLWNQGVDGFLPTIVTTSVENIRRSLASICDFALSQPNNQSTSQILGVHLEGPFLNLEKCGAHPAEYILPLTVDNVKLILGDYAPIVKIITLAPELDPTGEVIAYLKSLGITISLGHSQATATQAENAFKLGASMVTHAFNAMPILHHREPGLLGAAIVNPQVMCGLIADGQHVSTTMMQIVLRASEYEKGIFLVSDALSPLGLEDGIYPWDTRQIEVKDGTARLLDGTLSGTTLGLLVGVQNLVKWGICEVESAINLATRSPRQAIGLETAILGKLADRLLRWHLDKSTQNLTWQRLLSYNNNSPIE